MKNVLVIGGSGGIGKAISTSFSGKDRKIIVHGKTKEKVDAVVNKNIDRGCPSEGFVHTIGEVQPFIEKVKTYLPIHILIISYGPLLERKIEKMSAIDWEQIYRFNAVMPGMLISLCIPAMLQEKYGKIILFGGTGTGKAYGYGKIAAYASAKAGLPVIAKSVAEKYGKKGITCNVISPGFVTTEYYSKRQLEYIKSKIGSERIIEPSQIAELINFLISDSGSAINGAVIPADNGIDHL
jgi:NAD(P)-dependent dehydrogenase (short-subunit alcohol dehydrogenase family)